MRTQEETIALLRQVINNRREYVREKIKEHEPNSREHKHIYGRAMRGGMLCELTTIDCILTMIERGDSDPLTWWVKPLPQAIESTEQA